MMQQLVSMLLRSYQVASRALVAQRVWFFGFSGCRFYPTCSGFTVDAVARHGAARGLFMGARRVLMCHPFFPVRRTDRA